MFHFLGRESKFSTVCDNISVKKRVNFSQVSKFSSMYTNFPLNRQISLEGASPLPYFFHPCQGLQALLWPAPKLTVVFDHPCLSPQPWLLHELPHLVMIFSHLAVIFPCPVNYPWLWLSHPPLQFFSATWYSMWEKWKFQICRYNILPKVLYKMGYYCTWKILHFGPL